ncbi:MAG: NAD-binding protein, partial [Dehalococcoidia bacterium]|nr:NAD-binding protein [Dehalococcoidia bacterium]
MLKKRLGFIGLGIMGKPMCKNLIDAGYPVTVWDRVRPGIDECVGYGAVAGSSAKDVAEKSDVVITMVTASVDVEEVVLGARGILEGARPGMVLVDMSTISPRVAKETAAKLNGKGLKMLDAPVSGGDTGAREGTLSIMVGGPEEVFKECLPILEVLGKNVIHMGEENGAGQATKLCNQVIGAVNVLAVCEGFTLAAKSKLDMGKMFSAVRAGAAASFQLDDLGPRILERDWEPGFMVKT